MSLVRAAVIDSVPYAKAIRPLPLCSRRRHYSTEVNNDGPIRIEVGSSGAVSIDLFQPFSPIPPTSFLFYLPRGPVPFSSPSIPPEPTDLRPLAESAQAVVARINYRLTGQGNERYPLPIHDVASAWQWLFSLRMAQGPNAPAGLHPGPRHLPPIGVVGEFIGGSLAAMLALTECHAKPFPGITAAYLGNPIVDWTAMHALSDTKNEAKGGKAETKATRKKTLKLSSWEANASASELGSSRLLPLRQKLFADDSYWFDRFASPQLFFRTPASEEVEPGKDEQEAFDAVMETATEDDATSSSPTEASGERKSEADKKHRISHRRWPPVRSGLILPEMHLTLGSESPVRDMGLEFAKCVNRSVFMYEQEKAGELSDVNRATLEDKAGAGAWGGDEMVKIGKWFKQALKYE